MSIGNNVSKIAKDYGIPVQPVIDMGELAATKFIEPDQKWGLSSITALVLQNKVHKQLS